MTLTEYYTRMAYWNYADPCAQIMRNAADGLYSMDGIAARHGWLENDWDRIQSESYYADFCP